jgi:hypothetical protein
MIKLVMVDCMFKFQEGSGVSYVAEVGRWGKQLLALILIFFNSSPESPGLLMTSH